MESYEDSLKAWDNYMILDADNMVNLIKSYKDSYLKLSYDFLLEKEAELIKKICDGKTTIARVFTVYYYLLWNGYFSNNKCFEFDHSNCRINEKAGLSIITGKGVCLNISAHFCDILKHITDDYYGFMVGVHAEESDCWNATHSEIERNYAYAGLSNPECLLNHANVFIKNKDKVYILDPTNFLIYKVIKNNENKHHLTRIELRINIDLDFSCTDVRQLRYTASELKKLNNILATREYKRYTIDNLSMCLDEGVSMCRKHMNDIMEFREKYDYIYKHLALNMPEFSSQIKNKAKKLRTK